MESGMTGYIVFDSWPSKLFQKDQLIALGYGGSAICIFWQTLLLLKF